MTQGPLPPPLPAIPVRTLADYYSERYGRPGLITAIGIGSIVAAALSILVSGGLLLQATLLYAHTNAMASMPTAAAAPPLATIAVADEFLPADGLPAGQRQAIVDGLASLQAMDEAQRARLDALLMDSGRRLLLAGVEPANPMDARRLVREHGRLPGLGGSAGRLYFELDRGRLEIGPESAVFYPADGGAAVRTAGAIAGPDGSAVLSPAHIQAAIDEVQRLGNGGLNPQQVEGLRDALGQSWLPLIQPTSSVTGIRAQVKNVQRDGDGTVHVTLAASGEPGGVRAIDIDPDGVVEWDDIYLGSPSSGPTAPISSTSYSVAMAEALVSVLLAVGLLILGILTLRQARSTGTLLRVWALVKLLVAAGAAAAWVWFYDELAGESGTSMVAVTAGVTLGVMGMVWPIILLIVLHVRSVRAYYAPPSA